MSSNLQPSWLTRMGKSSDFALAGLLVAVIGSLFLPIPPEFLSFFLVSNILLSIVILITTTQVETPLSFSSFPSLLLITTTMRLALNVAASKLILGQGDAGSVIHAIGTRSVGGDYISGFIVFIILFMLQIMVVVKGAGRMAEVAARFHLDQMGGKQAAIDIDAANGRIKDEEIPLRRAELQRESDFYGAMDGASKFIQGEAIFGIVVLLVNILGGFTIGMFRHGLDLSQSLQRYATLTIGDGIATVIPSVVISVATGILISRNAEKDPLGRILFQQLFVSNPKIFFVAGGILMALSIVPGMAFLPFFMVGLIAVAFGYMVNRQTGKDKADASNVQTALDGAKAQMDTQQTEVRDTDLFNDELSIDFGPSIVYWCSASMEEESQTNRTSPLFLARKKLAEELGLLLGPISLVNDPGLKSDEYAFTVRGRELARGELYEDKVFVWNADPSENYEIDESLLNETEGNYVLAKEPTSGLPGVWIPASKERRAKLLQYFVSQPLVVLRQHFITTCLSNGHLLLSRKMTEQILEFLKGRDEKLVKDLLEGEKPLPLATIHRVLQGLLREGVPIKDMVTIAETLVEYAPMTVVVEQLIALCRQALLGTITNRFMDRDGKVRAFLLGSTYESEFKAGYRQDKHTGTTSLALSDEVIGRFIKDMERVYQEVMAKRPGEAPPALIVEPHLRSAIARLLALDFSGMPVLAQSEILPQVEIIGVGVVEPQEEPEFTKGVRN